MELEPITRKEKIIAGENLEPITRLEKFLKEYGGSGGSGGGGSTDAVLYTAQTLTDAQKKQARQNIGVDGNYFVVNGTLDNNYNITLDKTFAQIREAIGDGKIPIAAIAGAYFQLSQKTDSFITFSVVVGDKSGSGIETLYVYPDQDPQVDFYGVLTTDSVGALPQVNMSSDPTKAMQIATKKYVDDHAANDAILYTAQTLTDAQKKQARDNIDAEIADFVVNGTLKSAGSNMEVTLDKTFAQIQAAIQEGKRPVLKASANGFMHIFIPMVTASAGSVVFSALSDFGDISNTFVKAEITDNGDNSFIMSASPTLNSDGSLNQFQMDADPISPMQIATKKYVDDHLSGSPITIKLGTGNAATSTATFAEIKAALEAGKAPILDSATGNNHWFALNWMLSGSDRLSIQYGTFNVEGGGMANFTFYDVGVSSTGITYTSRQFTSQ